jgi:hypothetical protein
MNATQRVRAVGQGGSLGGSTSAGKRRTRSPRITSW